MRKVLSRNKEEEEEWRRKKGKSKQLLILYIILISTPLAPYSALSPLPLQTALAVRVLLADLDLIKLIT